jgi:hypothetical protein
MLSGGNRRSEKSRMAEATAILDRCYEENQAAGKMRSRRAMTF